MSVQCKDVPTLPILKFLAGLEMWGNWYFGDENDVHQAMPAGTPDKVVHAKMRQLIKRDLVDGCPCGCRGDFDITEKGLAAIAAAAPGED